MTNNLKNELEKIKMSEDTKERIIAACENSAKNNVASIIENDEYTDHVFTAERVNSKNRIMRTISAVAACAVIAGGIGTTSYLLNRNGSVPATETETTEPVEENKTEITPFGDFSTFDFDVYRGAKREKIEINTETKDNIAVFLNNFNWGEEVPLDDVPGEKIEKEDFDVYFFEWKKDDISYALAIVDNGFAMSAQYSIPDAENGIPEVENVNSRRINYEAFDRGMKEILKDEIAESELPTPFGDFRTFDFSISTGPGENWTYDRVTLDKLADFFNKFDWGEEIPDGKVPEEYETDSCDSIYHISWNVENGFHTIGVYDSGVAIYNAMYHDDNELSGSFEQETRAFYIDFEALDKGVQEILDTGGIEDISQSIDEEKQEYLRGFDDVQLVISLRDENDNEIAIPEENKEKLQTMIEGEFKYKSMLKSDPVDSDNGSEMSSQVYGVDLKYMSGGMEVLGRYYNIMNDGTVILSDCEYSSSKDDIWTGPFLYYIDLNEFYAKLAECGLR